MKKKEPIKLVRSRKPGGGRKPRYGEPTRPLSLRVPVSIPTELIAKIYDLQALLDSWEDEIAANPPDRTNNARYWHAKRLLEEIRSLGF